jgi:hypothetical protein
VAARSGTTASLNSAAVFAFVHAVNDSRALRCSSSFGAHSVWSFSRWSFHVAAGDVLPDAAGQVLLPHFPQHLDRVLRLLHRPLQLLHPPGQADLGGPDRGQPVLRLLEDLGRRRVLGLRVLLGLLELVGQGLDRLFGGRVPGTRPGQGVPVLPQVDQPGHLLEQGHLG